MHASSGVFIRNRLPQDLVVREHRKQWLLTLFDKYSQRANLHCVADFFYYY
jgi:hypothetical protein